jgi:hypothetical protein
LGGGISSLGAKKDRFKRETESVENEFYMKIKEMEEFPAAFV